MPVDIVWKYHSKNIEYNSTIRATLHKILFSEAPCKCWYRIIGVVGKCVWNAFTFNSYSSYATLRFCC